MKIKGFQHLEKSIWLGRFSPIFCHVKLRAIRVQTGFSTGKFEIRKYLKNFGEISEIMQRANKEGRSIQGGIVFAKESYPNKEYTETQRTYLFGNDNKAFNPDLSGYSIFADCEDGTDNGVRIDIYMKNKKWFPEKFFVEETA